MISGSLREKWETRLKLNAFFPLSPFYLQAQKWTIGTNFVSLLTYGFSPKYDSLNIVVDIKVALLVSGDFQNKDWQPGWTKATNIDCLYIRGQQCEIKVLAGSRFWDTGRCQMGLEKSPLPLSASPDCSSPWKFY